MYRVLPFSDRAGMLRGQMFPNVRLLSGALIASVVALSCGFALFAAFRVNHEPLSRLPVGTRPAHLVANEVAAPRAGWGTPFDGQSHANVAQPSETAADIRAANPASQSKTEESNPGTVGSIKPAAAADAVQHATAQPAPAVTQPDIAGAPASVVPPTSPVASTAAISPAGSTASPASVAPDKTASAPLPTADIASPPASANQTSNAGPNQSANTTQPAPAAPEQSARVPVPTASSVPATGLPSSENVVTATAATSPAADAKSAAGQDTGQAAKDAAPAVATAVSPDQPAAVSSPTKQAGPTPKAVAEPAKAAEPAGRVGMRRIRKAARKSVVRHRVVVRRHIAHKLRHAIGQDTGFSDPVFQSAPNFPSPSSYRSSASSSGWPNAH